MKGTSNEELTVLARAAAAGDRAAAERFVSGIQDNVYELSLRMLGHPADAEEAAHNELKTGFTALLESFEDLDQK